MKQEFKEAADETDFERERKKLTVASIVWPRIRIWGDIFFVVVKQKSLSWFSLRWEIIWSWIWQFVTRKLVWPSILSPGSPVVRLLIDRSLKMITGHSKKSVIRTVHLFFVGLYCCFTQTRCINNDWKCDFWHLRCLFYQVEWILFHLK